MHNFSFYSCQLRQGRGAQIRILMREIIAIKSTLHTIPNIASVMLFHWQVYAWCFHKTYSENSQKQRIWILLLIYQYYKIILKEELLFFLFFLTTINGSCQEKKKFFDRVRKSEESRNLNCFFPCSLNCYVVLNFQIQINEQFSLSHKNGFGSVKIRAISSSLNWAKRTHWFSNR